eukprot:710065-Amphidinium_carterae.1
MRNSFCAYRTIWKCLGFGGQGVNPHVLTVNLQERTADLDAQQIREVRCYFVGGMTPRRTCYFATIPSLLRAHSYHPTAFNYQP